MKYRIQKGSKVWGYQKYEDIYNVNSAQWYNRESEQTVIYTESEKFVTISELFIGFKLPANNRNSNFVMFRKEDVEEIEE